MKGIRGGIKNCFLLSFKKGGGAKNPYQKILRILALFLHQFLTNFEQIFFHKGGRGRGSVFYASPKRAEEAKGTEEAEGPEDTL